MACSGAVPSCDGNRAFLVIPLVHCLPAGTQRIGHVSVGARLGTSEPCWCAISRSMFSDVRAISTDAMVRPGS